ncbi:hypothetical protein [Roseofilum capinflatum]|uniref:Uncharacterized protein n=1 Tax=Roseofilum capinflatum BLCC-M114 TaxID=3022440 RepID=A0ABT7B6U1_9CYAN|nr:hypothetical protein [Roseofilum capinflatum]MDJ1174883.1 hypothetical protein [Roseofilum capinflatum BLCC-M114]
MSKTKYKAKNKKNKASELLSIAELNELIFDDRLLIVLESVGEDITLISDRHGVTEEQIIEWRDEILAGYSIRDSVALATALCNSIMQTALESVRNIDVARSGYKDLEKAYSLMDSSLTFIGVIRGAITEEGNILALSEEDLEYFGASMSKDDFDY